MTEQPRPRPFPETRPPHLPDVLTRQSPFLLFFVVVAGLVTWRAWLSWGPIPAGSELESVIQLALFSFSGIAPPLFGGALFLRHPNAGRSSPLLGFGLGLMSLGSLLDAFGEPIRQFLRGSASFLEYQTPGETTFLVLTGLLAVFGVLYTAAGLSAARAATRSAAERPIMIWLATIGIISVVLSLRTVSELVGGQYPAGVVSAVVIGIIVTVLSTLAWVYLATITIGGWLAGDTPRRAWTTAALGVVLLFAGRFVIAAAVGLLGDETSFFAIIRYTTVAGWLLLLIAFVLGLPSPPRPTVVAAPPTGDPQEATQPGSAAG